MEADVHRAAKAARQRRNQRHYGPADRGPRCPICKTFTVKALVDEEGTPVHPACDLGASRASSRK